MTDATDAMIVDDLDSKVLDTGYVKNPARTREAKPRPIPGLYYVMAGLVTAAFKEGRKGIGRNGEPYAFPDSVEATPHLSIVSDANGDETFKDYKLNPYFRLTNLPVERKRGEIENFSTMSSAMDAFGVPFPGAEGSTTVAELITASEAMSFKTSLRPVYISYAGEFRYKPYVRLGDGSFLRFSEAAFRRDPAFKGSAAKYAAAGGAWATMGWLINPDDETARSWTLERPTDDVPSKAIYANIQPTDSGFQSR